MIAISPTVRCSIQNYTLAILVCIGFVFNQFIGYSQNQKTLDSLEALIPKKKGEEKVRLLNDLTYYYYQSNPSKAIGFGQQALSLAQKINDKSLLASTLNDCSIPYLTVGNFQKCLALNKKALEIRKELKDSMGMISSYSKMGNAYYELTQYSNAQKAYNEAIAIAKALKQEGLLLQLYQNTANVLELSGYVDEALKMQLDVNKIALKINDPNLLLTNYGNIGSCYTKLNNYPKAREMYLKALQLVDMKQHPEQLAMIYQGLGVTERAAGNIDLGIAHYKKALQMYRQIDSETGAGIVAVNVGNSYLDMKQFDSAQVYFKMGLGMVKNTKSYRQTMLAYRGLSNLALARKDYEQAAIYLQEQLKFQDSVHLFQGNEVLSEMFTKYEVEKKERELSEAEALNAKNQLQKTIWISVSIGTFAILLFAVIIIIQRVKRNRAAMEQLKQEEMHLREQQLTDQKLSISRELHDNIGSQITYLISSIDNLTYLDEGNKVINNKLEGLSNFGRSTMTELRSTIWALNKEDGTLSDLIQRFESLRSNIPIPLEIENRTTGDIQLKSLELLNLFRIAQESIQNTIKYADATYIHIQLKLDEHGLHMFIGDNGKGFVKNNSSGNGIQNMKYRCEQIGGTFHLESEPGKGTQIRCTISNLSY